MPYQPCTLRWASRILLALTLQHSPQVVLSLQPSSLASEAEAAPPARERGSSRERGPLLSSRERGPAQPVRERGPVQPSRERGPLLASREALARNRQSTKSKLQQLKDKPTKAVGGKDWRRDAPAIGNSAGARRTKAGSPDVALLVVCLLIPGFIWGGFRIWDCVQALGRGPPPPVSGRKSVPRIGSLYRLQEQGARSMSPIGALLPPRPPPSLGQPVELEPVDATCMQNVLAGATTALAILPDAISFSFICGNSPLNGIWASVFLCLSGTLVGGRPGMISSSSATTAVVLSKLLGGGDEASGHAAALGLCVFIAGIIQIACGALKISRFMTLIPHPVMLGFVNGLAVLILKNQLRHFREEAAGAWVSQVTAVSMLATAAVTIFIAVSWKRVPILGKLFPATLAALIFTVIFSTITQRILPVWTLGDRAADGVYSTFSGGRGSMPTWDFPPKGVHYGDHGTVLKIIMVSVRFAIVGLLESLMTEALIDQVVGTQGSMRRECYGQGVGNVLAAMFGTQGGCALIGQSLLNISTGGRGRLSGVVASLTLILSVVLFAPLVAKIPTAAFIGLLSLVAINTFAWSTFRLIMRINWIDSLVVVLVTVITVGYDLFFAVFCGIILNGLGFAWRVATAAHVEAEAGSNQRTFFLYGPLFFGSAMNYRNEINPTLIPEHTVILDFSNCRILDISGLDAIIKIRDLVLQAGKRVVLRGVPPEALQHLPADAETAEVPNIEPAKQPLPLQPPALQPQSLGRDSWSARRW